jgi:hypothetical protein
MFRCHFTGPVGQLGPSDAFATRCHTRIPLYSRIDAARAPGNHQEKAERTAGTGEDTCIRLVSAAPRKPPPDRQVASALASKPSHYERAVSSEGEINNNALERSYRSLGEQAMSRG